MIFDDEKIEGGSSLENTRQHPAGISKVIVNGKVACEDGKFMGCYPGRILKKSVSG